MLRTRDYRGRHNYRRRMPVWLQAFGQAIGNGITFVILSTLMQPRLFMAACKDLITTPFRFELPKERTLPLLALALTVSTQSPVEV